MSNVQAAKQDLDNLARLQQMKINTRLTALQTALELMKVPNYSIVQYKNDPNDASGGSTAETVGGAVDHLTLLAMACDFEKYIIGELEEETKTALEAYQAKLNGPRIVRP